MFKGTFVYINIYSQRELSVEFIKAHLTRMRPIRRMGQFWETSRTINIQIFVLIYLTVYQLFVAVVVVVVAVVVVVNCSISSNNSQ